MYDSTIFPPLMLILALKGRFCIQISGAGWLVVSNSPDTQTVAAPKLRSYLDRRKS